MKGRRIANAWHLFAWLAVGVLSCSIAMARKAAQNAAPAPASIQEQLQAQYKLVKMGSDSSGATVIEEGTVLAIQKGGILGVPWGTAKACPAKYENGNLKPPSGLCVQTRKRGGSHGFGSLLSHVPGAAANDAQDVNTDTSSTRYFKVGEKVYPTKIAVDPKSGKIALSVVACDTCNKTDPPTYYKSEVDFQFDKGTLEGGDVSKIEDTIAQIFSIDNSAGDQNGQGSQDQGQTQAQGGQDQGQGQAAAAPAAAPAPAGPSLTNDDIIKLVNAKMSDNIIIKKIQKSAGNFDTSPDALAKLKKAGVSEAVINAMLDK